MSLEKWDQLRFDALTSELPAPIEEYFPYDPSIQYPYGVPVDNYYPSSILGESGMGMGMLSDDGISVAADMNAIPENMYDNAILRALEYTGFDVQWLKDNGYLYVAQYVSSNLKNNAPNVLSNIGYDDYSPFLNGDETVTDSSTVSGKAPDIARFEKNGMVCASFVTYFIGNFLPNIEGIDTTNIMNAIKATTMNNGSYSTASVWSWSTGLNNLAATTGSGVTKYAQIVKETSTGEDLGGWKFNIYADETCTTLIDGSPFTSANDGTIKVKLSPGTYWVQEIDESDKHPDWTYDTTVRKVTVTAGNVAKVTFTNTHYGYAEIQKTTNTGKDLGGWKFDIFTDADCTQYVTGSPFTTDDEGKMSVRLLPGTYFVQEVDESETNPDWVYDTKIHIVTVRAGETVSVELENQQMGRVKLIKAMPDGGAVSGWVFDIYRKSDNVHMGTFTSGEDGTIISDWFLPGEYLVYEQLDEQSIYWCETENPQEVTIKAGEAAEVTFTNRLKPGKISIQKVDITGQPLAGAEFLLEWSVDGTHWQPVSYTNSQYVLEGTCTSAGLKDGKLVSDENGLVEFTGLHPERLYRLTETAAPEGYQLLVDTAYEGCLPADNELTIELTVVNAPTFELPKTGSKSMLLMPISLVLVAALCGAIVVIGKRKEQ